MPDFVLFPVKNITYVHITYIAIFTQSCVTRTNHTHYFTILDNSLISLALLLVFSTYNNMFCVDNSSSFYETSEKRTLGTTFKRI